MFVRLTRLVAITGFAVLATACGGTRDVDAAEGGPDAKEIDLCALMPIADVAKVVPKISNAESHFSAHTYMKPVNYTAGCVYGGYGVAVILSVNYPVKTGNRTSQDLANSLTTWLEGQAEDDPDVAAMYKDLVVRPVAGMSGPAAEYEILDQTYLEVHAKGSVVKSAAPSLDQARTLAEMILARVD